MVSQQGTGGRRHAERPDGPPPRLEVTGISKHFGPVRVLDRIDLSIRPGEVHALVGHNGSGKSTLVKVLGGHHAADPGALASVDGAPWRLGSVDAARQAGLRFVHQNLGGLIQELTVADNIAMAQPDRGLHIDRRAERTRAVRVLRALGSTVDPSAGLATLSSADRTLVAVARATTGLEGDGVLVLDEPTASLSAVEVAQLFESLQLLVASGTSILFITHHLEEVLTYSDRVTVLRDGRVVASEATADVTHEHLIELMLGRSLERAGERVRSGRAGAPVLRCRGLRGSVLTGLDLDVAAGEIVGIAGLTGSGREEVADLIAGRSARSGQVAVEGATVHGGSVRAAVRAGVGMVPADRRLHGLLNEGSVRENLTIADLDPFWARGRFQHARERRHAAVWIDRLQIRSARVDGPVAVLSGGTQQKVLIARWLRADPKVLVLDEPTQGVDVGARRSIHQLLRDAAAGGVAVVACSSDSEELAALSDRVVVIARGRCTQVLGGGEVHSARIDEALLAAASTSTDDQGAPRP